MRDHLPELVYSHRKAADFLRRLDFGEIAMHDSTSLYTLGNVIPGGSHEVRRVGEPSYHALRLS
jgi:hypothetical protein